LQPIDSECSAEARYIYASSDGTSCSEVLCSQHRGGDREKKSVGVSSGQQTEQTIFRNRPIFKKPEHAEQAKVIDQLSLSLLLINIIIIRTYRISEVPFVPPNPKILKNKIIDPDGTDGTSGTDSAELLNSTEHSATLFRTGNPA
jgi:hypothetical protein